VPISLTFVICARRSALQSTLINLLQGKLTPQVGYIRVNPQLRVGIFTQHHMDSFDLSLSPIQNMALRWPLINEVGLERHFADVVDAVPIMP
jgi:ATPase subunit of ABC transporter with duplicated ATPase domains